MHWSQLFVLLSPELQAKHATIVGGLQILLSETRRYIDGFLKKVHAMQEIYLRGNSQFYTEEEADQLRYYLSVVSHKSYLATLCLEQLWAMSYTKRRELFCALQNSLDRLECSDDELLMSSFALENFLFQARAFLDFYMLYICLCLRTGHTGKMSKKKFEKELIKVKEGPFAEKAQFVKRYFDTKVFGPKGEFSVLDTNNWGTLLLDLRDKIAHQDRLRPSFRSKETLLKRVLFDWPTLQDVTYERFCQYMDNGMCYLFIDILPILYGLEWKPGPYSRDMWEQTSS